MLAQGRSDPLLIRQRHCQARLALAVGGAALDKGLSWQFPTRCHQHARSWLYVPARLCCSPLWHAQVRITGHSLGGALATLAAYDIAAAAEKQCTCRVHTTVYTFGAPRVGNHAFAKEYRAKVGLACEEWLPAAATAAAAAADAACTADMSLSWQCLCALMDNRSVWHSELSLGCAAGARLLEHHQCAPPVPASVLPASCMCVQSAGPLSVRCTQASQEWGWRLAACTGVQLACRCSAAGQGLSLCGELCRTRMLWPGRASSCSGTSVRARGCSSPQRATCW